MMTVGGIYYIKKKGKGKKKGKEKEQFIAPDP